MIVPGYCIKGTLGNSILSGAKKLKIDEEVYDIKMRVNKVSFSAHADNRGIVRLVKHL